MKYYTFAYVVQKTILVYNNNNNSDRLDKYRLLIENLVQLGPNDWSNYQEQLKKTKLEIK